jgi:hypothetical protein
MKVKLDIKEVQAYLVEEYKNKLKDDYRFLEEELDDHLADMESIRGRGFGAILEKQEGDKWGLFLTGDIDDFLAVADTKDLPEIFASEVSSRLSELDD